ncbi:Uncharacterised protein [uncultured archaeon]|nr:Uncharacterised protein [uncultured archaeon]
MPESKRKAIYRKLAVERLADYLWRNVKPEMLATEESVKKLAADIVRAMERGD